MVSFPQKNQIYLGKKEALQSGISNHDEPCASLQENKGEAVFTQKGRGSGEAVITTQFFL